MKILFTICGRAGSKGIKNKNIRNFLGFPLPYYSLSAIDLYLEDDKENDSIILVNTDSAELIDLMKKNPFHRSVQIVKREPDLAGDQVSKIAVIRNSVEAVEKSGSHIDMVVDLDITSPLRTAVHIKELIETQRAGGYDVTFSVTEARRNPYFNMVRESEFGVERVIASGFVSRQSAPVVYDMNASLYAYSPEFLRKGKEIFEGRCGIIRMMDTGILDLDHEHDLELMEVTAQYIYKEYSVYGQVMENIAKRSGS